MEPVLPHVATDTLGALWLKVLCILDASMEVNLDAPHFVAICVVGARDSFYLAVHCHVRGTVFCG